MSFSRLRLIGAWVLVCLLALAVRPASAGLKGLKEVRVLFASIINYPLQAQTFLAELSDMNGPAVFPYLEQELASPDPARRALGVWFVSYLMPMEDKYQDAVLVVLQDAHYSARAAAIRSLVRIGMVSGLPVLEYIENSVFDPHGQVRKEVLSARGSLITDIEERTLYLMDALKDQHPAVRLEGFRLIGELPDPLSAEQFTIALGSYLYEENLAAAAAGLQAIPLVKPYSTNMLKQIAQGLQSDLFFVRLNSIRMAGTVAFEKSFPVLDGLLHNIVQSNEELQKITVQMVLLKAQHPTPKAVDILADYLGSDNEIVQEVSAFLLGKVGRYAYEAVPLLLSKVYHRNNKVAVASRNALIAISKGNRALSPDLLPFLQSKDQRVRAFALEALGNTQVKFEVIKPYLEHSLVEESAEIRNIALLALPPYRQQGLVFFQILNELSQFSPDGYTRFLAYKALNSLRLFPMKVMPIWIAALADPDLRIRILATNELGDLGPVALSSLETFSSMLERGVPDELRLSIAQATRKIRQDPRELIFASWPVLLRIKDRVGQLLVANQVSTSLPVGQIRGCLNRLFRADDGDDVGSCANIRFVDRDGLADVAEKIFDIESALDPILESFALTRGSVEPVLVRSLRDPDKQVANKGLGLLLQFFNESKPARIYLVNLISDPDVRNRVFALQIARETSFRDSAFWRVVKKMPVNERDANLRAEAMLYLVEQYRDLPEVSSLITWVLFDQDRRVRSLAIWLVGVLQERAAVSVPGLIKSLKDRDKRIRSVAANALGEIGAVAVDSLPALHEARNDVDAAVRLAVGNAIALIGRSTTPAASAQ